MPIGQMFTCFCDFFSVRISDYDLRLNDRLDIPHARTDKGLNRCDVIGARLWNKHLELANKYLFKKSFWKQISRVLIEIIVEGKMYMHAYLNPVPPEKSMNVITNYISAVYHNEIVS